MVHFCQSVCLSDCLSVRPSVCLWPASTLTLAPGRPDSPVRPGSPVPPLGPAAPATPRSPGAPYRRKDITLYKSRFYYITLLCTVTSGNKSRPTLAPARPSWPGNPRFPGAPCKESEKHITQKTVGSFIILIYHIFITYFFNVIVYFVDLLSLLEVQGVQQLRARL